LENNRVPQYFIKPVNLSGNRCRIEGDDYIHLSRVRRVRSSDIIHVRLESGELFSARVVQVHDSAVEAELIDQVENEHAAIDLTLCMCVMKGKKNDQAIRDAVEVGVSRIVPVISRRTIPDLRGRENERTERWNRIALEAAKQCMQEHVPVVEDVCDFETVLLQRPGQVRILAHPAAEQDLNSVLYSCAPAQGISLLVGPEGGFDSEEVGLAEENGWRAARFGFTHMRAETAAVVLPALIIYALGSAGTDRSGS